MSEAGPPPRPPLPFSLVAAAAAILSIRSALSQTAWHTASIAAAALLGPLLMLLARRGEGRRAVAAAAAFLLAWAVAGLSGSFLSMRLDRVTAALDRLPISSCSLITTSDPRQGDYGWTVTAQLRTPDGRVADVLLRSPERIGRARILSCVGRFSKLEGDYGRSQRLRGIVGSVSAVSLGSLEPAKTPLQALNGLREALLERIRPEAGGERALLAALVLGSREGLTASGDDRLLSRIGLAHLVAVSGTHLAILGSIVEALLAESELGPHARRIAIAAVTLIFALMSGGTPSALRSWAMLASRLVAESLGRGSRGADGVGFAACGMLAVRPQLAGETGFLLSVICVSSLCLLGPYAAYAADLLLVPKRMPRRIPARWQRSLKKAIGDVARSLSASLVALLACLPLTVPMTSCLPLAGPIACIAMVPLFSSAMILGFPALLVSAAPLIGSAALHAACLPCRLMLDLAALVASFPLSSVPAALDAPMLALSPGLPAAVYLLWPKLSTRRFRTAMLVAFALLAALLIRWRFLAPMRVAVLDVGQGDAVLVQDGPHAVLVDTGPDEAVVAALGRMHVLHLDAVVVTHLHDDHYGGLDELAALVPIGQVLVAEGASEAFLAIPELAAALRQGSGASLAELAYGDSVVIGSFVGRVVWPRGPVDGTENAHSIELLLEAHTGDVRLSLLLTGDAEQDETGAVVASGEAGDIDVLKVGHHGSAVSIDAATAASLKAELALVSAGEGNEYGHPAPECVRTLEEAGSRVLTTIDAGDISVFPGRSGPRVRCPRGCG